MNYSDILVVDKKSEIKTVVFCIECKIVEDAEYVDASWSDRTFVFEVDL